MAEKVYLTSDQYVVKLLQQKEQELDDLNERYNNLIKKFIDSQSAIRKYEEVKSMFALEETSSGNGYQVVVKERDGNCSYSIAYCWNKEKPNQEFLDLLELLGIKFPGGINE